MKASALQLFLLLYSAEVSCFDLPVSGFSSSPSSSALPYETRYIQQPVNHSNPESPTFRHRYLYSDQYWGKGQVNYQLNTSCPGPILIYTGNEGDVTGFWPSNGWMTDVLAPQFGGLLLFPEERYYGVSLPFGNQSWTPENVVFLSTMQVLEDYANLVVNIKKVNPQAAECPVLAFGGSYGGTLTAAFRSKFPSIVTGGVASSSEMGYYDHDHWAQFGIDEFTFSKIAAKDYADADPSCLSAIDNTVQIINNHPVPDLVKIFRVCEPAGLGPNHPSELFQYALEGLPQLNYPYAIGTLPASPVNAACNRLTAATKPEELLAAAAEIVGEYVGSPAASSSCIPTFVEGPGGIPGDGPGPDSWGFQSCTECLHPFSSHNSIRNYTFSFKQQAALCKELFSVTPSLYSFYKQFGGFGMVNTTSNMIWSSGALDPWSGGALRGPSIFESNHFFFRMEGAAHHLDLKAPNKADPPAVTAAREKMQEILFGYMQSY